MKSKWITEFDMHVYGWELLAEKLTNRSLDGWRIFNSWLLPDGSGLRVLFKRDVMVEADDEVSD